MGGNKAQVLFCVAGVLWVAAVWLLVRSTIDADLLAVRAWGQACMGAAATLTVCAAIVHVKTRLLRAVHRAQLEDLLRVSRS